MMTRCWAVVAPPAFSPGEGDASTKFEVTVSCPTPGAELHYTLNGAEPTLYDPEIDSGGKIPVNRNFTLKAKAWLGSESSTTATALYKLTGDVSAGGSHSMALTWAGSVWAWGAQNSGRLGNGMSATADVPLPTSSLYGTSTAITDGLRIAAGRAHSVVLSSSRDVWAFGNNANGALGDNTSADKIYAGRVLKSTTAGDYLTNCVAVSAGIDLSMALSATGNVYTWGIRTGGRLGDGNNTGARRFAGMVEVDATTVLGGITAISAGGGFGMAREKCSYEDPAALGRVWAWGHNGVGQLGNGNTTNRARATMVMLDSTNELRDAWDISGGESHAAVVRWKASSADLQGTVWTFGEQQYGRLGNNATASANVKVPAKVLKADLTPLQHIQAVACGSAHTLALDDDGHVWAWGYGAQGAIGDGFTVNRATAVLVKNPLNTGPLENIVRIAAGGDGAANFSMAIAGDGSIYMWGRNESGQLGNGTVSTAATSLPVKVSGMAVLPLVPDVSLALAINEGVAPGQITVTANPTHGSVAGSSLIERVDLYLNGQNVGSCFAPNWKKSFAALAGGDYHLYGIAYDFPGNSAMSLPLLFEIGTVNLGGPGDDPDGDGLTNAEEAILGTNPGSASFSGHTGTEQYSYDYLDRLTGVSGARTHSFNYDAAGNVQSAN